MVKWLVIWSDNTNDFASYIHISFNISLDWVWSYIHSWKSYSYGHVNETPLPGFNMGSLQNFDTFIL